MSTEPAVSTSPAPTVLSAGDVALAMTYREAADVIENALTVRDWDPSRDPSRELIAMDAGQLLVMTSEHDTTAGIKCVGRAPGNSDRGEPLINGLYVLLDRSSLIPKAILDGAALTTLRTPAVSACAVRALTPETVPGGHRVVIFGAGPQAIGHAQAIAQVREVSAITIVGRRPEMVAKVVAELQGVAPLVDAGAVDDVATASIVVGATSAPTPLFDGQLIQPGTCVVAMGSHHAHERELDGSLMGRSIVVVEDSATALREAGDAIMAIGEGHLEAADLVELKTVLNEPLPSDGSIRIFKGVGMAWQDLAIAGAVVDHHGCQDQ